MAGLLGNFDLNDPAIVGAIRLMMARKGETSGLLGQLGQEADQRKQKQLQEQMHRQQMEMSGIQLQQARQGQEDQAALRMAYKRNVVPGGPQMLPTDMEVPSGPAGPSSLNMRGYQNDLLSAGPAGFAEYIKMQQANKPEVIGLKAGETAYDKRNNKALYTAPAPQSTQWKELGRDPMTKQMIMENTATGERKAVGSMPQSINVNTNMPPLEKREQGDKGALNVKNFGVVQDLASISRKENALLTGLERMNLDTGALTPANVTVSAWVAALGGGDRFKETAAQGQGFTAFAKDLVLQRQLAQKGPQTESDAKRLEQTVAQLGNTSEANKLLVTFQKTQNKRTIEQEKFYNDWWKKNKTYEGADDAWISGKGASSVWDEPELKRFQSASQVIDFSQLPHGR